METNNFKAMVTTASNKYTKLIEAMYNTEGISDADLNRNLNLIHSIYADEMDLIAALYNIELEKKEEKKKVELKLFDFMVGR